MSINNHISIVLFMTTFVTTLSVAFGQIACPSVTGVAAGIPVQNRPQQGVPLAANTVFIIKDSPVNCYGVIKGWRYWKRNDCDNVRFQVYRPNGGNYILVGENAYDNTPVHCPSFGTNMQIDVPIAQNQQIPVEPGDVIGWEQVSYTPNNGMIPYDNGGGVGTILIQASPVNIGTGYPFAGSSLMDPSLEAVVVAAPAPTLDNLPNTVSVYENLPVNSYVFGVTANEQLTGRANVWINAVTITYSLSPTVTDFRILNTGQVQTNAVLDYELRQTYSFDVTIESMTHSLTQTLTVQVLDVNEQHTLSNLPATKTVSALVRKSGDQIFQVTVTDPDTINPSTIYYSIRSWTTTPPMALPPPPPFSIDLATGAVTCSIDMEQFTFPGNPATVTYQLTIGASDGTYDTTGVLSVPITSVHQPPAFINVGGGASTTIPENLPGGSHVYKALASAYGLSPSTLTFSIDPSTALTARNTFTLEPSTGDIYLVPNPGLDVSVQNTYTLSIVVSDGLLSSTVDNLMVLISWVDQTPQFDSAMYQITIPEKCNNPVVCCTPGPPGCILPLPMVGLTLTVIDRDVTLGLGTPLPDSLVCTVQPGYGSTLFVSPMASCNTLEIAASIDVDTLPPSYSQINLTIKATDLYGKSDIAVVTVNVVDINDNAPFLLPATYVTSIPENTAGGYKLTTFTATDGDSSLLNSEVRYSIQNYPDGLGTLYFEVNAVSGELRTKQGVDYETYTSISFDILATDLGSPPQTSVPSAVTILITDVNDNYPLWDCSDRPATEPYILSQPCFYNLELRADTLIGYNVQQLLYTDLDLYPAKYELLKPDYSFLLQMTTGWIQVKDVLQTDTKYTLYCIVSENGPPQLLSVVLWVRIDTYTPSAHLVDITLGIPGSSFNTTAQKAAFLAQLRYLVNVVYGLTWWVQIESVTLASDRTVVTIYAIEDTTTYDLDYLGQTKIFVSEDALLPKLRKNFYGAPNDDLAGPAFAAFQPILVGPAYPNWWLDTIPGLCVLVLLCLLGVACIAAIGILICKRQKAACFKPTNTSYRQQIARPVVSVNGKKQVSTTILDEPSTIRQRLPPQEESPDPTRRRISVDSIHSVVYDPLKNVNY